MQGEAGSADVEAASYMADQASVVSKGGSIKQQSFCVDRTALCWKEMLSKVFMARQRNKQRSGVKELKGRLTLLFRMIAAGDYIIYCIWKP